MAVFTTVVCKFRIYHVNLSTCFCDDEFDVVLAKHRRSINLVLFDSLCLYSDAAVVESESMMSLFLSAVFSVQKLIQNRKLFCAAVKFHLSISASNKPELVCCR